MRDHIRYHSACVRKKKRPKLPKPAVSWRYFPRSPPFPPLLLFMAGMSLTAPSTFESFSSGLNRDNYAGFCFFFVDFRLFFGGSSRKMAFCDSRVV